MVEHPTDNRSTQVRFLVEAPNMALWYIGITLDCPSGKPGSSPGRVANLIDIWGITK